MFILLLTYTAPTEDVDRWLEPHRDFLRQCYADRLFLASGPQVPRTGGVIIARGPREELDKRIADDPFTKNGIARYQVIQFEALWHDPCLEPFLALGS